MLFENHARCDALRDLRELVRGVCGYGLDEEVHMILVRSYFVVSDFVPLLDAQAYLLQRCRYLFREHIPSILRWADEVVQEERFVVAFYDVLAHSPILAQDAPAASCGEIFLIIKSPGHVNGTYPRLRYSQHSAQVPKIKNPGEGLFHKGVETCRFGNFVTLRGVEPRFTP